MLLAEFGTGQVFWSLLWLSLFCIWVWMFIMVFGDLIRSRRLSGWGKALWALFIIVLPILGCLVYLGARGSDINDRMTEASRADAANIPTYLYNKA